jgi:hypothetical protein
MRCFLIAFILLTGCSGGFPLLKRAPDVPPEQAERFYQEGEFKRAAQAYLSLAKYDRNRSARYKLRAAEAYRQEGEWSSAELALDDLRRRDLLAEEALTLDLLHAEMALNQGDVQAASDLLVVAPEAVPPSLRPRLFELRARVFEAAEDWADAARERAALDLTLEADAERADNAERLRFALSRLPPEARSSLIRTLGRADPLYRWLTTAGPGVAGAASALSFAETLAQSQLDPRRAEAVSLADVPQAPTRRIALLLPAAGELAPAAAAIRDGVFSAYFHAEGMRPELVLIDSGSSAESGLAAYDKATQEGADLVIGPFARDQVSALFTRGISVPMLALNYADQTLPPAGSFQFALLPEEEAVMAADRLFALGKRRVSALVPDDEFGRRTLSAFQARFAALGGVVVDPAFFATQATQHNEALRQTLGLSESATRAAMVRAITGLNSSAQPTRRFDLDAIFLAARPGQARLLLPQMKTFDLASLPVVATSHVYAGAASALDGDLNGVEFVDAPWLDQKVVGYPTRAQVQALPSSQGPAARLFAFGMDAYVFAVRLPWLERERGVEVQGATGAIYSDGRGSLRREGVWRRFEQGRSVPAP